MIKYFLESFPDGARSADLQRATDGASGYDLRAMLSTSRDIAPGQRWLVPTGLYLEMPRGVEAQVRSRSGLAIHQGVIVLNAPGTIDSDYRGEVKVSLINLGQSRYAINPGERIAQLVFAPVYCHVGNPSHLSIRPPDLIGFQRVGLLSDLSDTVRGSSGHGSTGR